jgi:hypothetical protein
MQMAAPRTRLMQGRGGMSSGMKCDLCSPHTAARLAYVADLLDLTELSTRWGCTADAATM